MHKQNPGRIGLLSSAMGMLMAAMPDLAHLTRADAIGAPPRMKRRKNKGGASRIWHRSNNKYDPKPTVVRNALVAIQINQMHAKWFNEQFPSRVTKRDRDPNSINSIKLGMRVHRPAARMIKVNIDAKAGA